jgi:glycerol kinase
VLKVDGGMTANSLLMQFQSDVLGVSNYDTCLPSIVDIHYLSNTKVPLVLPVVTETTALGVALAGALLLF